MLTLVLILLVLAVAVGGALTAWSLWLQPMLYNEASPAIVWGGPAAGVAVALFLAAWVTVDYQSPGPYRELHAFSASEYLDYPELRIPTQRREEVYELRPNARGLPEYLRKSPPHERMPSRPDKVTAYERDGQPAAFPTGDGEAGGAEVVFEPARDEKGNFRPDDDGLVYYRDGRGREMVEGQFGRVTTFHPAWLIGSLLLNFLHLVVWFAALWLLLRFEWGHALLQALVLWAVMTFFVVPPLLDRAEAVAAERDRAGANAHQPRLVPGVRVGVWSRGSCLTPGSNCVALRARGGLASFRKEGAHEEPEGRHIESPG